jgi:signal transduction histidine kinase
MNLVRKLIQRWRNAVRGSLIGEYIRFAGFFILILCVVGGIWGYFIFAKCQAKLKADLEGASHEIQKVVKQSFKELHQLLLLVGKEISQENLKDVTKIAEHLKIAARGRNLGISWTVLDWIDESNNLVANCRQGVLPVPKKIYQRRYLAESSKSPWSIITCTPDWGNTSGLWVVPVGLGVVDDKGKFIGTIAGGIDIYLVSQKLKQALNTSNIEFTVLDQEMKTIFHSLSYSFNSHYLDPIARKLFSGFECAKMERSHYNDQPIEIDDISFQNCAKIEDFSYYIFVGYPKNFAMQALFSELIPSLLKLFCFGLFSLFTFYIFWRKKISPIMDLAFSATAISRGEFDTVIPKQNSIELDQLAASLQQMIAWIKKVHQLKGACQEFEIKNQELQEIRLKLEQMIVLMNNSDIEKERFLQQIDHEHQSLLIELLTSAKILLTDLEEGYDFNLSNNHKVEFLRKIIDAAESMKTLTTGQIRLSEVDVDTLINDCVLIHSRTALLKKITIVQERSPYIPKIFLDEFKFKQIILGLFSRAIKYTPEDGEIFIKASHQKTDDFENLLITVNNSGFGFTDEDIDRIEHKFSSQVGKFSDLTALEFSVIRKLVELHDGTLHVSAQWQQGTSVLLTIPYNLHLKRFPHKQKPLESVEI